MNAAHPSLRLLPMLAVSCTLALGACALGRESQLEDVVSRQLGAERQPLVVIPGILGSGLVDTETGKTLWPPNLGKLIRGWRVRHLALPLEEGSASADLTDFVLSGLGHDYYRKLVDTLTAAGYECAPPNRLSRDTDCILFTWDWRQGFVVAAERLERVIDQLRAVRGDADLSVDIVAHSGGAMIARYYVRFGGTDVVTPDAADFADLGSGREPAVRRVILIGPPNEGSLSSVEGLMRGYRVGPFTVRPDVLATFETSFQLLPHPDLDWVVERDGTPASFDLYDIETWRILEESIFDPRIRRRIRERSDSSALAERRMWELEAQFSRALARGKRFHEALSSVRPEVSYLVFGSDCEPTPRRGVIEADGARPVLRFDPKDIADPVPGVDYQRLMLERGDGRVTWSSLLGRGRTSSDSEQENPFHIANLTFTCAIHSDMAVNFEVRHNLLNLLFY